MKKKVLSILLIGTLFIGLTGCANNSGDKELENTNQNVELTKEEQIWKDATD